MAQFKFRLTNAGDGWHVQDPVTGDDHMVITLPADAGTVRNLALYGLKQAVSDGGAREAGTSVAARARAMRTRYDQIHSGAWAFRDGVGGAGMPDAMVYRALVALGLAPDTADQRDKWRKLPAAHRAAIAQRADVRDWIAANSDVSPDDALATFVGQPLA